MHLHMTEITINLTIDQDDESFLFTELQHGVSHDVVNVGSKMLQSRTFNY